MNTEALQLAAAELKVTIKEAVAKFLETTGHAVLAEIAVQYSNESTMDGPHFVPVVSVSGRFEIADPDPNAD